MNCFVSAILTQPVSYFKYGVETILPKGKLIQLDVQNNIGYVNGDCIQLNESDYRIYMN